MQHSHGCLPLVTCCLLCLCRWAWRAPHLGICALLSTLFCCLKKKVLPGPKKDSLKGESCDTKTKGRMWLVPAEPGGAEDVAWRPAHSSHGSGCSDWALISTLAKQAALSSSCCSSSGGSSSSLRLRLFLRAPSSILHVTLTGAPGTPVEAVDRLVALGGPLGSTVVNRSGSSPWGVHCWQRWPELSLERGHGPHVVVAPCGLDTWTLSQHSHLSSLHLHHYVVTGGNPTKQQTLTWI